MEHLKSSPPDFVRTVRQIDYYEQIIDLLEENSVPIKDQDKFALGTLAINLALIDLCVEDIEENGMMIDCDSDRGVGIKKVNPAIAMQKDAQTAVRFYFKEFQMSPNSRGNNLVVPPTGKAKESSILDRL